MHYMIDLETMGLKPDAAIISIGAVCFDLNKRTIVDTFYRAVDLESAIANGGTVTGSTISFWISRRWRYRAAKGRWVLLHEGKNIVD